ncbi:MAG: hypothetical protein M1814_000278 [Vezdaea aestivalis]|nr:MAG: hypothetical protein M1814_000278 [Vezdaea aestivalis]
MARTSLEIRDGPGAKKRKFDDSLVDVNATPRKKLAISAKQTEDEDVRQGTQSQSDLPVRGKAKRSKGSKTVRLAESQASETVGSSVDGSNPREAGDNTATNKRSNHLRFDDNDRINGTPTTSAPAVEESEGGTGIVGDANRDSDSGDDDEAPEAVTLSGGLERAQAREKEIVEASAQQDAAAKQKRQKVAKQLQEQAEAARQKKELREAKLEKKEKRRARKAAKEAAKLEDERVHADEEDQTPPPTISKSRHRMPLLLPDELLEGEDEVEEALVAAHRKGPSISISKKQKFLDEPKRAKAVRKGKVMVQVLDPAPGLLAPPALRDSRRLKDSWLQGGSGGTASMRAKWGAVGRRGFVRKP